MNRELEAAAHPNVRNEPRDVNIRTAAFCFAGFVLIAIGFHLSLLWFYGELTERDEPSTYARAQQAPPAPRLQAKPDEDEQTLRREQEAHLHSYGWVDRAHGIAHIPIERALELSAPKAGEKTP